MRQTIEIQGAREHNLKNINVEIPRDKFIVVTGLSGSGKSSLAFDTLYAEGQRRFMESLSAFARRFVEQLKKPAVDFVYGLSPVISIEQKSVSKNPRSTIGTMTDIYDYMRLLYCTLGVPHCPWCHGEIPVRSAYQMAEHLLAQPDGTIVEICAPVFKIYGEEYPYLIADVRGKGYRRMRIDGEVYDISEEFDLDETRDYEMEVIVDRFVMKRDVEKQLLASIQHGLKIGEGFLRFRVANPEILPHGLTRFYEGFACSEHQVTMGEALSFYYGFNDPDSACVTCSGLGTYLKVHPGLLVPDPERSILNGAFVREAYNYDKNTWAGAMMYSLSERYQFSLSAPFRTLPPEIVEILFYGSKNEKITLVKPDGFRGEGKYFGHAWRFNGIINDIERRYRHYRKKGAASTGMEEYLRKVMIEHTCPDCDGTKLKRQRMLVEIAGKTIHELGEMNLSQLRDFLDELPRSAFARRQGEAGEQVLREIVGRVDLLLGIGLEYLNLNRRAATLSGGESQRIRLSTQISSGLMGMLYVLDEPSIGLHPKDNVKLIDTLKRLRDIGNTVIVVEHDEDTIRAAEHILEIGPGPGVHGGQVVAQGTIDEIIRNPNSLTGQYLGGQRRIPLPARRRTPLDRSLWVMGARQNNLRNLNVEIPLGVLTCVTGASGSGKSTLINDILFKKLYSIFHDSRVLSGQHESVLGVEAITDVISIDQTPIGRSSRSNPATYIGFYDDIRRLFADTPDAVERNYTAGRFSFNVKGGRCEECAGEGMITTSLHFMPDVETPCPACKGKRYNEETLEIQYEGKTISDVLDMTIEEGVTFFRGCRRIAHKLDVLNQLGLGYLTLGQSSTTLSGGEAQRIKLADELGKIKRGAHNLYILDEPTTGLHLADIQRLLDCLNRLVDAGNTVLVIEHHLDVIKTADYVIDLGPEGGHKGGEVVAEGTPEQIQQEPRSYTGMFLKAMLERSARDAA